jgi:hypothetical protein
MISFEDAHRLALALKQVGQEDTFLGNEGIPLELRERVWSFMQGDLAEPTNSLPGDSLVEWFEDVAEDSNWMRYIDLLDRKDWPQSSIQNIDSTTKKILNFCLNPQEQDATKKYGLVVGHVQSGKTANFTGLLARAADSGYNLFIVLAGLHNNLRLQTQVRLMRELLGKDTHPKGHHVNHPISYDWNMMTTKEDDFIGLPDYGALTGSSSRSISIIKKNVAPLTKLLDLLKSIPEAKRSKMNVMIVDDESDHATINTMIPKPVDSAEKIILDEWYEDVEEEDEEEDFNATIINSRLREIIKLFPRTSYVGYTATPFANVLIDPIDEHEHLGQTLYPRDFIVALPKPNGHMGLDEFFPDSFEMSQKHAAQVKIIPITDADNLRLMEDSDVIDSDDQELIFGRYEDIPISLRSAIFDYMLSGAAKFSRGFENFHHSMLVHIKHTDKNQSPVWRALKSLVRHIDTTLANNYARGHAELKNQFKTRWNEDFSFHEDTNETWDDIWPNLQRFISEGYEVMKINYRSQHNMDFESRSEKGLRVIAVGGNRLSRGLTIEGLSCSYFVRETKMYDTLTQMGRWFGFRPKYQDLVRVHITPNLLEWFTWLTGVERELRDDIARYADTGLKPSQLAVRILKHRKMLPTSKSKMRSARIFRGGLDETCPRNKKFCYDDYSALESNISTTGLFLSSLGPTSPLDFDESMLWRGVSSDVVLNYLQSMIFHQQDNSFNELDIASHINTRVTAGELNNWSIALIHNSNGSLLSPFSKCGFDHQFGLSTRSRLFGRESIGELMQAMHFAIDLPGDRQKYRDDGKFSYNKMYRARTADNPLLVIYVLDKDSTISKQARQPREELFSNSQEKAHIIGLAIAFPRANLTEYERSKLVDRIALRGIPHEPEIDIE